jgi:hypothetical protein
VAGLNQADRFEPASRRDWTVDRDQALSLIIEAWTQLLGTA